jgi:small-conductance mechanosensitive channel
MTYQIFQITEKDLQNFWNATLTFLINLLLALLVFAIFALLARWVRKYFRKLFTRTSKNVTVANLVSNILYIVLISVAVIGVFAIFTGLGVGGFFTALGFLGAGIALSLQDVFKNFFSGIYLLVEKPFQIGDIIRVKDVEGEVVTIEYRTTILKTDNEIRLLVPNSIIFTEIVTHRTMGNNILNTFKLAVPEDFGLTATTNHVNEVVETFDEKRVVRTPSPKIYLEGTQDGNIIVRLEIWTNKEEYFVIKSELANALRKALPEVSITVL